MEKSASLYMADFDDNIITVSTTRSGGNNIFVEWEWNEDDDYEKIYNGAYSAHRFGTDATSQYHGPQRRIDYSIGKRFQSSRLTFH